jgi:taurine dioxygenase
MAMSSSTIDVRPISGAVGAEIHGVDLSSSLSDDLFAEICQAYDDHGVIFFRDQELRPEDHIAFAERWGDININRFFTPVDDYPMIAEVRKEPEQKTNIGSRWHTDHSYDQVPAMGSVLYALEVPTKGGDTLFASMAAAYDALSDGMKSALDGLEAHHSSRHAFGLNARQMKSTHGNDQAYNNPDLATQDAIHPVVLTHPRTGRKGIYVNGDFTTHFVGWTRAESNPLLEMLYSHATEPRFTGRFRWEKGSVALWDNLAVQHCAVNDYQGERRLMHRITVEGTPLT